MTDTLDASVGKLLVVGGRAVSASPPGALVEPPPRRAARGREADTLFLLVTPAGSEQTQAAFYEDLARRAGDTFFASPGSVTNALREMVGQVNGFLLSGANPGRYRAGLICLVLRGADCYLARVGAVLSLLSQDGLLHTDPEDLKEEHSLDGKPLGEATAPEIKFAHYSVAPDQTVVLADAGLAAALPDQIQAALNSGDLPAILDALKPLAGTRTQALIIRFTSSNAPANPNGLPTLRPRVESMSPAPPLPSPVSVPSAADAPLPDSRGGGGNTLPAAVNTPTIAPAPIVVTKEATAVETTASATPISNPLLLSVTNSSTPTVDPPPRPVRPPYVPPPPISQSQPEPIPTPPPESSIPDVSPVAAEGVPSVPNVALHNIGVRIIRLPFTVILTVLQKISQGINLILNRALPESADGRIQIPLMTAITIAILIPVLVVFVTVGLKFSQIDQTNFEKLVIQLQDQAKQAQNAPAGNPTLAKQLWQTVLEHVADAERQRPGDPALEQIRSQAVSVIDQYEHVTRRNVIPVRVFGQRAALGPVLVQGGADIYTLDTTDEAIYRDTLRQPDTLQTHSSQPIVQSGSALTGYSVKTLTAMIWMEEGGIRTSHALVALDPQGFLVTYSPILATALAQPLLGAEQWKTPIAIRTWQGRLYILDSKANQIWRYVAIGTTYPNAPEEYFNSDYQRNLAQATDFTIDEKGNVYILFADGSIKEYTGGAEQPFTLANLPDAKLQSGGSMYLDSSTPLPALYVTDPVDQSIYEFTLAGTFQARFKALDPRAFDHMAGLFVQGNNIYVTAGTTLYYFNAQ